MTRINTQGNNIMDQAWPVAPTAEEAKEMEQTLRQYLLQMRNLNRQMEHDQTQIEQLKRETSLLREKSERLGEETGSLLKALAALNLDTYKVA